MDRQIILADANPEVRAALRLVIEQGSSMIVTSEASSVMALLQQVIGRCAQVVLLDIDLPGLQPDNHDTAFTLHDLITTLHTTCPNLFVISLSSQPTAQKDCFQAEADAFICKSDPPDALLALLRQL